MSRSFISLPKLEKFRYSNTDENLKQKYLIELETVDIRTISKIKTSNYFWMFLRGQMNLAVFLNLQILNFIEDYQVFTFNQIQFMGLSSVQDDVTLEDFKTVSFELKQSFHEQTTNSDDNINNTNDSSEYKNILYCNEKQNNLSESFKMINYSSVGCLFSGSTNHYQKPVYFPLSKQNKTGNSYKQINSKQNKNNSTNFDLKNNELYINYFGPTIIKEMSTINQDTNNDPSLILSNSSNTVRQ